MDSRSKWFENCLGALDGTYIKVNVSATDRPRYRTRKGEVATNVLGVCDTKGYYYLYDAGYLNVEGFLAPYRGERYYLSKWRGGGRWAILRGKSYYPVNVQCRTIMACCLLHNLINREMTNSEIIDDLDEGDSTYATTGGDEINYIEVSNEWSELRDQLAYTMFSDWELRDQMTSSSRASKHTWTKEEEAKLVECLVELVSAGGWRSNNGTFRHGYLAQLQRMMVKKLSDTNIQGSLPMDCRVKSLKKHLPSNFRMRGPSCSGFGWNEKFQCIIAERDLFDNWVKSHPTAEGLLHKSFPYYDDLSYVFDKDRATEARLETFADVGSNVLNMFNDGVPLGDSYDQDIPAMYSQGVHISPD
ncbi:retrotransposon protein [Cucumis melo var. makuwa]|uniref:Retrotransposon protein n=1 Tax=Cucumis melo var. makuwa TaxID=1194695 RepID=A0A5A7TJS2_CUCMM|nr:retrotransposon protein [Cucumis melo var. makuwa]